MNFAIFSKYIPLIILLCFLHFPLALYISRQISYNVHFTLRVITLSLIIRYVLVICFKFLRCTLGERSSCASCLASQVGGVFSTDRSRDSSVGIALGYGLEDRGSTVRFPEGAGNFSLHHRVQNGSGAHPASYPIVTK
jgi:hypothetical protein